MGCTPKMGDWTCLKIQHRQVRLFTWEYVTRLCFSFWFDILLCDCKLDFLQIYLQFFKLYDLKRNTATRRCWQCSNMQSTISLECYWICMVGIHLFEQRELEHKHGLHCFGIVWISSMTWPQLRHQVMSLILASVVARFDSIRI